MSSLHKMTRTMIATAGLLACFAFPNTLFAEETHPAPLRKVTVSSAAVMDIEPSYVLYKAFLSNHEEGADKAYKSAQRAAENLTKALSQSGIAAQDISQGHILVTMAHADKGLFSGGSNQSFEFEAKSTLSFKIRDLDKTGTILDEATKAGITRLSNPAFIIEKAEKWRQEARNKALDKARAKAEDYAAKAGLKLVALLSVEEERQTDDPSMWPYKGKSSYGYSGYEPNGPKPTSSKAVPLSISLTSSWQLVGK